MQTDMDVVQLLEIVCIAIILLIQLYQYSQNKRKINNLENVYPGQGLVIVDIEEAEGLKLINPNNDFAEGFLHILSATNLYLQKNRGAAADFNILKDISERESEALENEIESNIALPLYVGLLGTFLGVIIGLVRIAFFSGINDASIQSFLGGVLIGMAASACGLLLTTLGNYHFRRAKLERDRNKNTYYTFLQAELLPSLASDMASSLGSLKDNLDAFNQEFSQNISSFKGTVAGITENLSLQKEFLEMLQKGGYQQIVQANVEVFDRIEKSMPVLDRFIRSIEEANALTEQSKASFSAIKQIMDDLKGFREGIHGLGRYMQENDNLIEKQVRYLNAYIQTAGQATDSMGKHFDKADDAITRFVEKRIQTLMEDSRKAAVQVEEYFARLREDNIHVALARQIDSLKNEIEQLNNSRENYRFATQLVNQPPASRPEPAQTIIREVVPAEANKKDFVNSQAFKIFVYISTIFYGTALAAFISFLLARFMNP
jgi:biopolymer transport protein ExbB/TolQ